MSVRPSRVLVVEDEAIIGADIRFALMKLGHEVPELCMSGEEAWESSEGARPDAWVVDVNLAGSEHGVDLMKRVREADAKAGRACAPVVFISAFYSEELAVEIDGMKHVQRLSKPFSVRRVSKALSDLGIASASEVPLQKKISLLWGAEGAGGEVDVADAGKDTLQGSKVLLFEDDVLVRRVAERILSGMGVEVHAFGEMQHVEEVVDGVAHLDAAVIDLHGEERFEGVKVMKRLLEKWPNLALVISSGSQEDLNSVQEELGASLTLLPKPYDADQLCSALRLIL